MSCNRVQSWAAAAAILLAVGANVAQATVFFTDGFDYSDGQLTNHNGGTSVSGNVWTTHSPTPTQTPTAETLLVAGGVADVRISGTEDINRAYSNTLLPGGSYYFGAKITVHDNRTSGSQTLGTGTGTYFMHLKEDGTAQFRGRLYVRPGTETTAFTLGISSSSINVDGGAIVPWGSDLAFDTQYTVIVAYTPADEVAETVRDGYTDLWVGADDVNDTKVTDSAPNPNISNDLADPMVGLALRQDNAGNTQPNVLVDIVSVGDSFEEVLAALSGSTPVFQEADFNEDNDVDAADLATWEAGFGTGTTKATGDADGDEDVDGADLLIWQQQFPFPLPAVGAVPEPASLGLAGIALAALASSRRRK